MVKRFNLKSKCHLHVLEVLHCPVDHLSGNLVPLDRVVSVLDGDEVVVPVVGQEVDQEGLQVLRLWWVVVVATRSRHFWANLIFCRSLQRSYKFRLLEAQLFFVAPSS